MDNRLEQIVAALAGDGPLGRAALAPLSGLDRDSAARVPALLAALPVDRQRQVVEALVGEAELSFDLDYNLIYRALLGHTDATIRRLCIEGLFEDEHTDLIAPFIRLMETDPDVTVRAAAADALGRYVFAGEVDELPASRALIIREALERQFLDPATPYQVARRALESLAYINGDDTIKGYIDRAYSADQEEVRLSAVFAMGRSADPVWADIVLSELYAESPAMRYEAARACGELQLREAVEVLERMVGDRDPEIRYMAVQALGQIGGDEARKALERLQEIDDPDLHEAVEDALGEAELADTVFDMMIVDPADAEFVMDDDNEKGEEAADEEAYRAEFNEYVDEDNDDDSEWPDEYLSLN